VTELSHTQPALRPDGPTHGAVDTRQASAHIIDVVLVGGPASLPKELRTRQVASTDRKIKVAHRSGYEHFERETLGDSPNAPVVFSWTGRTRVAE
jgi:Family of unknown function (DUF5988)